MVAGLVGEGLTGLFVASGMENVALAGQGHRGVGPLVALRGELVWPFCARFSVRRGVNLDVRRLQRPRETLGWPTRWGSSFKRPTSSETTWRITCHS